MQNFRPIVVPGKGKQKWEGQTEMGRAEDIIRDKVSVGLKCI